MLIEFSSTYWKALSNSASLSMFAARLRGNLGSANPVSFSENDTEIPLLHMPFCCAANASVNPHLWKSQVWFSKRMQEAKVNAAKERMMLPLPLKPALAITNGEKIVKHYARVSDGPMWTYNPYSDVGQLARTLIQ